jgi:hypothetical protein
MFGLTADAGRLECEGNGVGAVLMWGYAIALAHLLAGPSGLQARLYYWHRQPRRLKIGYRAHRRARTRRRPSKSRRRTRAVMIPGIYG